MEDVLDRMEKMKQSLDRVQRPIPMFRFTDWTKKVTIMEPIDEIVVATNPKDHYELDFIEESDSGDEGKWVKHVSQTHNQQNSAIVLSDPVSPPSPATQRALRQYEATVTLSRVSEYLLSLDSSSSTVTDEEDSDEDDGVVHCTIDGVEQLNDTRCVEQCKTLPSLNISDFDGPVSNSNAEDGIHPSSYATIPDNGQSSQYHSQNFDTSISLRGGSNPGLGGTEHRRKASVETTSEKQDPSDLDDYDMASNSGLGSEYELSSSEAQLELFMDFPDSVKNAIPLITDEELEYGAMEMTQNPWEYIEGNDLLPTIKSLLRACMSE